VLYTINPFAGEVIVDTSFVPVNAIRGGKNPLLVAVTSSTDELFGVFVPIPTCEKTKAGKLSSKSVNFFIIYVLSNKSSVY
jgi:hypothetical protein